MKQNIASFIGPKRLKRLLVRLKLTMFMNQSIVKLYKTKKHIRFWFWVLVGSFVWIIDSVVDHTIIISKKSH